MYVFVSTESSSPPVSTATAMTYVSGAAGTGDEAAFASTEKAARGRGREKCFFKSRHLSLIVTAVYVCCHIIVIVFFTHHLNHVTETISFCFFVYHITIQLYHK